MVLCTCTLFNYWVWILIGGKPGFCSWGPLLTTRDTGIDKICRVYRLRHNFIKYLLVATKLIADIVKFTSAKMGGQM